MLHREFVIHVLFDSLDIVIHHTLGVLSALSVSVNFLLLELFPICFQSLPVGQLKTFLLFKLFLLLLSFELGIKLMFENISLLFLLILFLFI